VTERLDAPTVTAVAADVLDRRERFAVVSERRFDEQEHGLDVRIAGIEGGKDADFAGLHVLFLGRHSMG